ncbi:MAG: (2Fe-2S)-binding protein [candidate division WOR-3 bacterium]|nr:(2Fe-2S)-binding protein [candidate division WOR-3 bacterium]
MKKKKSRSKTKHLPETIICRCEEVTEQEILQTIRQGYHSLEELKRILRCGMGHCQGRTCLSIIARMIARETNTPVEQIKLPTSRPPLKPISLSVLSEYQEETR